MNKNEEKAREIVEGVGANLMPDEANALIHHIANALSEKEKSIGRSMQRRIAAQKGLPIPMFDAKGDTAMSKQEGKESKHGATKGPWMYLPPLGEGDHLIVSHKVTGYGNFHVAVVHGGKQAEANARLIVRAVNAHDELLVAAKAMIEAAEPFMAEFGDDTDAASQKLASAWAKAGKAIAEAEFRQREEE